MSVKQQYERIQANIHEACSTANRNSDQVNVIAVTKYVSEATTRLALESGVEHIGENRAETGLEKKKAIGDAGTWHFIGSLQSRKVKQVIHEFDYFHSLDRLSLAREFQKQSQDKQKVKCFVQVNVSGEESKSGLQPEEVLPFIERLEAYPAIEVVGLMTMAPFTEDPEQTRPVFRGLRELRDAIAELHLPYAPCTELSMGMSNDYIVAVEEGATFIRIGTALVGNETTSSS
ncbi:YggS family pyridoxal phosphate-dependent enzyme [Alkalicoccobacillus plakortidis]|uniref:Pyridoxal phosphate homeostasis protein n=1 Tax=Alkalicoccobacillus plakortidis TaxID=444060 RepID=A0ABT0XFZ6_9BACI|nr:YggS family pyridoxal phosphate-dependent enzyme [Alkalicoccobacillus plakortidis]MCM2674809.1 YggS family pyridoxal phosphate-dependent enzyme [Alkalicoccobacillus plakortidis]